MLKRASLDDKYDLTEGRIFLTGVQALVRLPLEQRRLDRAVGLNTAGYVTGYRGSPLATYDLQLSRAAKWLRSSGIHFQPGLNEDLALTSVWGSQQAEARGDGKYDGVFALWYGKGAGVDRSGDAFRHGNNAGSSKYGGVLILLGDDHRAESSSAVHASELSMVDFNIPVLNPADVGEILDYGLIGVAMSRFTGSWVALKCNHEVVESGASIDVAERAAPVAPDFEMPEGGLNIRIPDTPLAQEARVLDYRLPAVRAFARANRIDRAIWRPAGAKLGIVTTGKAYLEVLQGLEDLGIDAARAEEIGIALYKVGMPWPLEPEGIREFCAGLDTVICVEEKRGLIEPQIKDILFGERSGLTVIGKRDERGRTLFQETGALSSNRIGIEIARRIGARDRELDERIAELEAREEPSQSNIVPFVRKPYFCSGCPHNRSTVVPEGSRGGAGTGCNYMVMWMERGSDGYTQMGADGANWIGEAPFSNRDHMFQNMGDGTYNHSGLLAIRAAVAAKVNITYKILFNDAVAMTGGQTHEGALTVSGIARQVLAEGVSRVVLVSDDLSRQAGTLPAGISSYHRDDIDAVQRQLRDTPGVTVLIYDQMCATEKRRRRKRGTLADPDKRAFINHLVCEGCGDCGVKSNCVSILPRETEFGRKREIDQHSCNKDFSCVEGFCPSFVTVQGGRPRKPSLAERTGATADLREPAPASLDRPYNIVLSGVGGAGIVTMSSILGMAAHLEGKGCSTLDMMGLAQKGGAVTSHVRIARDPSAVRAARIPEGAADLAIGSDIMSVAGAEPISTVRRDRTQLIVNTHEVTPGEFTRSPDLEFPTAALRLRIDAAAGAGRVQYLNAIEEAKAATGDPITANMLILGYAFQQGLVPLTSEAIRRAVELNGAAVEANLAAFEAGRRVWAERETAPATRQSPEETLDQVIERHAAFLADYQNDAYARRYREFVARARTSEREKAGGSERLTLAVARNLGKLMAYKDEYEVARLHASEAFRRDLDSEFEGPYRLKYHLAPPLLARRDPATGEPRKMTFGSWVLPAFRLLAKLKVLRGTPLDIFGRTGERRMERRLIADYEETVLRVVKSLEPDNHATAVAIASLPATIRGFGHVKLASAEKARAALTGLLEQLEQAPLSHAAE